MVFNNYLFLWINNYDKIHADHNFQPHIHLKNIYSWHMYKSHNKILYTLFTQSKTIKKYIQTLSFKLPPKNYQTE